MKNQTLFLILSLALILGSCNKSDEDVIDKEIPTNLKILWLGTSIPEGCSYPAYACQQIGAKCINNSKGASFLAEYGVDDKGVNVAGYSLTETIEEKEQKYRPLVNSHKLSENQLNYFKELSYESLVKPFIKDVDVVVIDHGYNDNISLFSLYDNRDKIEDQDTIWSSTNKKTFIGAFNYLYKYIKESNPKAKVLLCGYFQNTCTVGHGIRGRFVTNVLKDISRHYHLPLIDDWNYTSIPDGYMPGSENYLDSINRVYGTTFTKWMPNELGQITFLQHFCPDTVHPFSDPTGKSDSILNQIVAKLLPIKIKEAFEEQ